MRTRLSTATGDRLGAQSPGEHEPLLRRLANALSSRPFVHELVQTLAGQGRVAARLGSVVEGLPAKRCLDVGSAAGGFARRLEVAAVAVDVEMEPLIVLRRRSRNSLCVVADARFLPFPKRCFDLVLFVAVSHHLDDEALPGVLNELSRVVGGNLLFLDAVRNDRRRISRWLWQYDRGRFPRSRSALLDSLEDHFEPVRIIDFSVYHQYVVCVARPRGCGNSPGGRDP